MGAATDVFVKIFGAVLSPPLVIDTAGMDECKWWYAAGWSWNLRCRFW